MEGWESGGAKVLADKVKVTESNGKGLGWVAEENFSGEAADCDASAADGVKEGGVGKGNKRAGDIGGESSVLRLEMGGTVKLMERAEISGGGVCTWGGLERVYGVSGG